MNRLALFDGIKIAYQEWGSQISTRKILALHGWLDNSNSFCFLGPYLADRGYHVVAIDQAGEFVKRELTHFSLELLLY